MGGNRRRPFMLGLAVLLLFGTLNAAAAGAAAAQPPGRPDGVAAAASPATVVTAPGAFDTRLLSETRPEPGQRTSRHDGFSAAGAPGPAPGLGRRRAVGAAERAAHPERRSGTRLRGPPRLPV